jgi:hypothetical protein
MRRTDVIPLKPGVDLSNIHKFTSFHTGNAIRTAVCGNDRSSEKHVEHKYIVSAEFTVSECCSGWYV